MDLTRVAVVALATSRVVDTVKEALPAIPPPWQKSLFAAAVGAGASYIAGDREPRTVAVTGLAAAGLAALVHDIQVAASSYADNNITEVLGRLPRPSRQRAQGPLGT